MQVWFIGGLEWIKFFEGFILECGISANTTIVTHECHKKGLSHTTFFLFPQDVVLMCQAMEKVFNQKLATMPPEVIRVGYKIICQFHILL